MRPVYPALSAIMLLYGGIAVVSCNSWSAPAPRPATSARVEDLSSRARSANPLIRQRALGQLLKHLKRGMTRAEVETLMGLPDLPVDEMKLDPDGNLIVIYDCLFPGQNTRQMMSVHYNIDSQPYQLIEVEGPHFPE